VSLLRIETPVPSHRSDESFDNYPFSLSRSVGVEHRAFSEESKAR